MLAAEQRGIPLAVHTYSLQEEVIQEEINQSGGKRPNFFKDGPDQSFIDITEKWGCKGPPELV